MKASQKNKVIENTGLKDKENRISRFNIYIFYNSNHTRYVLEIFSPYNFLNSVTLGDLATKNPNLLNAVANIVSYFKVVFTLIYIVTMLNIFLLFIY